MQPKVERITSVALILMGATLTLGCSMFKAPSAEYRSIDFCTDVSDLPDPGAQRTSQDDAVTVQGVVEQRKGPVGESPERLLAQANAYFAENRYHDSARLYKKYLATPNATAAPADVLALAHYRVGFVENKRMFYDRARDEFAQAVQFAPFNDDYLFSYAKACYDSKDFQQADAQLSTLLARTPNYPQAQYYFGLTLLESSDRTKAMEPLTATVGQLQAYALLADKYFASGELERGSQTEAEMTELAAKYGVQAPAIPHKNAPKAPFVPAPPVSAPMQNAPQIAQNAPGAPQTPQQVEQNASDAAQLTQAPQQVAPSAPSAPTTPQIAQAVPAVPQTPQQAAPVVPETPQIAQNAPVAPQKQQSAPVVAVAPQVPQNAPVAPQIQQSAPVVAIAPQVPQSAQVVAVAPQVPQSAQVVPQIQQSAPVVAVAPQIPQPAATDVRDPALVAQRFAEPAVQQSAPSAAPQTPSPVVSDPIEEFEEEEGFARTGYLSFPSQQYQQPYQEQYRLPLQQNREEKSEPEEEEGFARTGASFTATPAPERPNDFGALGREPVEEMESDDDWDGDFAFATSGSANASIVEATPRALATSELASLERFESELDRIHIAVASETVAAVERAERTRLVERGMENFKFRKLFARRAPKSAEPTILALVPPEGPATNSVEPTEELLAQEEAQPASVAPAVADEFVAPSELAALETSAPIALKNERVEQVEPIEPLTTLASNETPSEVAELAASDARPNKRRERGYVSVSPSVSPIAQTTASISRASLGAGNPGLGIGYFPTRSSVARALALSESGKRGFQPGSTASDVEPSAESIDLAEAPVEEPVAPSNAPIGVLVAQRPEEPTINAPTSERAVESFESADVQ